MAEKLARIIESAAQQDHDPFDAAEEMAALPVARSPRGARTQTQADERVPAPQSRRGRSRPGELHRGDQQRVP